MEHAFPPPFHWFSNEGFGLLVIAGLMLAGPVVGCFVVFRRKTHPLSFVFWILLSGLFVFLAFKVPAGYSSNWRHVAVARPIIVTCGFVSAAIAFVAGYCEFVRLWKARKVLETLLIWVLVPCVLFLLLFPGHTSPRWGSPRAECKNNLKQIGLALHNYHEMHRVFPASRISDPFVSWRVHLLQFLEFESLYWDYDQEQPWDSNTNTAIAQQQVWGVYDCPSRPVRVDAQGRYFTDYAMLTGRGAFSLPNNPIRKRDVGDGLSNTLAVTEASGLNIVWTEPRDAETDSQTIGINLAGDEHSESRGIASSRHPNGAHVLFADGSVKLLDENIDPQVLKALTTIGGDEPVGDF